MQKNYRKLTRASFWVNDPKTEIIQSHLFHLKLILNADIMKGNKKKIPAIMSAQGTPTEFVPCYEFINKNISFKSHIKRSSD